MPNIGLIPCHHILPIIVLLLNYVFILRRLLNYFYYRTIFSQLQTSTTSRATTGYCCFSVDNYIVNICIVQLLCTWTLFLCMYVSVITCVCMHTFKLAHFLLLYVTCHMSNYCTVYNLPCNQSDGHELNPLREHETPLKFAPMFVFPPISISFVVHQSDCHEQTLSVLSVCKFAPLLLISVLCTT